VNKHLYLCHPLVLSSPTLMMHGHTNLQFTAMPVTSLQFPCNALITVKSNLCWEDITFHKHDSATQQLNF